MGLTSILVAVVCPFIYICLLTGLFIYLFRKKLVFQNALPVSLLSTTLFVYLFTMVFHNISFGFWITVIAALGFLPLLVFDKDRSRVLKESFFTPGFAIFCIIYAFLIILDWYKVVPLLSDTTMHWAPHVRTMWLRNDFYTSPGTSLVIHGEYPPALQLFELIFSKAANVYREGLLFVAAQLLGFSLLLPISEKLVWQKRNNLRQWFMILLVASVLLALPFVFFVSDFYSSLEVDAFLGIVFAYSMWVATKESRKFTLLGAYIVTIAITFLSLTKQIAVLLAGLALLVYLCGLLLSYRKTFDAAAVRAYFKQWKVNWKRIALVILLVALPLVSLKLWSHQIKGYTTPDPGVAIFHVKASDTLQIPHIISGASGSPAQQIFSRHFFSHVLFDPGGFLLNYFGSVSYMQIVILFVGTMGLVWLFTKDKDARYKITVITAVMAAGWFLYLFAIYCTFLFGGMKPVEMLNSDTSNRYLRTYLFALLIIAVAYLLEKVIIDYQKRTNGKSFVYFIATIIIVAGLLSNKSTLMSSGLKQISTHKAELSAYNMYAAKADLNEIADTSGGTFKKPTKILVTARTDDEKHYLRYAALPDVPMLLLFESNTSQESVCDKLANSSYFVVDYNYPDKKDVDIIENCLSSSVNLTLNSVYKISEPGGHLQLRKVF